VSDGGVAAARTAIAIPADGGTGQGVSDGREVPITLAGGQYLEGGIPGGSAVPRNHVPMVSPSRPRYVAGRRSIIPASWHTR